MVWAVQTSYQILLGSIGVLDSNFPFSFPIVKDLRYWVRNKWVEIDGCFGWMRRDWEKCVFSARLYLCWILYQKSNGCSWYFAWLLLYIGFGDTKHLASARGNKKSHIHIVCSYIIISATCSSSFIHWSEFHI
jgi:hypothetical protein